MADEQGLEFFIEIEGEGAAYRNAKAQALDDLAQAIELGLNPGRVIAA